jgi:hypothetical protein
MIRRTYMCPECAHRMEVILTADEWNSPPPSCEMCDRRTNQEFKPPAIGGSVRARASKIAEDIVANDYNVANFHSDHRIGGVGKVRYKDETPNLPTANWQATDGHRSMLETAISIGKANRGRDGLNILQKNLASGVQPDLIEQSKRRSIKVW